MDSATAMAAANPTAGIKSAQVTPIMADNRLPANNAQGVDSCPCGTANSKTVDAPMEGSIAAVPAVPVKS